MSKDNSGQPSRKVVGVFKQIWLLLWKNGILFRRNKSGLIAEILVALLFVFILIVLRFFVDVIKFSDQSNVPLSVLASVNTTTNRTIIMYYPNNAFIKGIVDNAITFIRASQRRNFPITSILLDCKISC